MAEALVLWWVFFGISPDVLVFVLAVGLVINELNLFWTAVVILSLKWLANLAVVAWAAPSWWGDD